MFDRRPNLGYSGVDDAVVLLPSAQCVAPLFDSKALMSWNNSEARIRIEYVDGHGIITSLAILPLRTWLSLSLSLSFLLASSSFLYTSDSMFPRYLFG